MSKQGTTSGTLRRLLHLCVSFRLVHDTGYFELSKVFLPRTCVQLEMLTVVLPVCSFSNSKSGEMAVGWVKSTCHMFTNSNRLIGLVRMSFNCQLLCEFTQSPSLVTSFVRLICRMILFSGWYSCAPREEVATCVIMLLTELLIVRVTPQVTKSCKVGRPCVRAERDCCSFLAAFFGLAPFRPGLRCPPKTFSASQCQLLDMASFLIRASPALPTQVRNAGYGLLLQSIAT